jgi:hypothetical protein
VSCAASTLDRHDDLIGLDLERRRAGRASALPRLHARQARPLLRQVRPAALRRRAASRSRKAGPGSRRTWAATASPATSSCSPTGSTTGASSRRTPGRCRGRRSGGASPAVLSRPLVLRLRRPGSRAARAGETALLGLSRRARAVARPRRRGWRAEVDAAGTVYEVGVHASEVSATHLTCSTRRLSRPKRYVAGSPRARAS